MAEQLSTAHAGLIDDLCRDFGRWAPGETAQPVFRGLLGGGHSNVSALIGNDVTQWVVRIPGVATPTTVCRWREADAHCAAASAGLAPELCFWDPGRGILITRYVRGDADTAGDLPRLAGLLRGIHALPARGPAVHTPQLLAYYRSRLHPTHPVTVLLDRLEPALARARRIIARAATVTLCHNDLLKANRLVSDSRLLALDWEYAAPGDPLFDLAVCASELPADATATLLEAYLGRHATDPERERLMAQQLLYTAIEACWHACFQPDSAAQQRACQALRRYLSALPTGTAAS